MPDDRYIQSREERVRDVRESCREFSEEARARGLTLDIFCEIMEIDDETRMNLFGAHTIEGSEELAARCKIDDHQ